MNSIEEQMPFLAAEYGVARIGLFGSFAAQTAGDESDIDLLVEFNDPIGFRFMELVDYLESLLGRNVDVLTPAGLQGIRVKRVADNIYESVVYV
ncbi:MAG: nucleotidyltransferase family protein [Candidatus Promineifilaceae bacterium]